MVNFTGVAAFGFALTLTGASAMAADVAPAPAPAKQNTISAEFGPEWKTTDGTLADDYVKFGYAHTFDNNVVLGTTFQYTWRPTNTSYDQLEAALGYKIKLDAFTLTPGVILGYGFGDLPSINPAKGQGGDPEAYYAFAIAGDLKLDDHWTWNVFNARYRNAFDVTWITPKIATGITYKFDNSNAIYTNVGYAWKDTGNGKGLQPDKWNVAIGYRFSF